jgi:hypothetical protein
MPELIAKVTVVTGLHKVTKQPIEVAPGAAFNVRTAAEAEHLVAIDAAEHAAAPAPAEAPQGDDSGQGGGGA